VDLRWQMVLDCLGAESTGMCPGDTGGFSRRLIALTWIGGCWKRTVELARRTEASSEEAAKNLQRAIDSSPLEGVGAA